MLRPALLTLLAFTVAVGLRWGENARVIAATPVAIEVTSTAAGAGVCPHPVDCTLRTAITAANADSSGNPVTITFAAGVFPAASPAVISISSTPLPALTRPNTTIDASAAGVYLRGVNQSLSITPDGLVLAGDGDALRGLVIQGFSGACVVVQGANVSVGGDSTAGQGNILGSCGTGVLVTGVAATITGNHAGFTPTQDNPAPVTTGVQVNAGGAVIGGDAGGGLANVIGNAATGIRVGGSGGGGFTGPRIVRNVIGRDPQNHPAPVTTSVDLRQPSSGSLVTANDLAYATTGISIAADASGISVTGNWLDGNLFHAIAGLAIDLDANGIANPIRAADGHGANRDRNHPVISRAVQARIAGSAGSDCAGCAVQLYLAEHRPGSTDDYGSVPVSGGTVTADSSGAFVFDNPAVTPGQWVTALVTDAGSNTSEFGPSTRVGSGLAQCGNVQLAPGWNQAGYFGSDPVVLGDDFPIDPASGKISAIYHYDEASGQFFHWFANSPAFQTLSTLQPGEAYWFLADSSITLSGGFSLSVPVPVQLKTGWNEIVYIGASADVRDALSSVAGAYRYVYHWNNDGTASGWQSFGDGSEPSWADDFSDLQTCATYEILATADGVLTPLQP